jgi:protein SCO1/2
MSRGGVMARPLVALAIVALVAATAITMMMARRWAGSTTQQEPALVIELPPFALVDQRGEEVTLETLGGTPWVANFIFTRCVGTCPLLTREMNGLGERLPPRVRRVSISVDPEHDTPEVLAAWAERVGIVSGDWLLLTGEREAIHRLTVGGFKLALDDEPPAGSSEPIVHSTRLVLVDGAGAIRGYYDAFDPETRDLLLSDLAALLTD